MTIFIQCVHFFDGRSSTKIKSDSNFILVSDLVFTRFLNFISGTGEFLMTKSSLKDITFPMELCYLPTFSEEY